MNNVKENNPPEGTIPFKGGSVTREW